MSYLLRSILAAGVLASSLALPSQAKDAPCDCIVNGKLSVEEPRFKRTERGAFTEVSATLKGEFKVLALPKPESPKQSEMSFALRCVKIERPRYRTGYRKDEASWDSSVHQALEDCQIDGESRNPYLSRKIACNGPHDLSFQVPVKTFITPNPDPGSSLEFTVHTAAPGCSAETLTATADVGILWKEGVAEPGLAKSGEFLDRVPKMRASSKPYCERMEPQAVCYAASVNPKSIVDLLQAQGVAKSNLVQTDTSRKYIADGNKIVSTIDRCCSYAWKQILMVWAIEVFEPKQKPN